LPALSNNSLYDVVLTYEATPWNPLTRRNPASARRKRTNPQTFDSDGRPCYKK
jgi:hypothetical protein